MTADFDPAALARLLRQQGLIGRDELRIERLAGGQSNPTYRIGAGDRRYVLRKKPPGTLLASAHAVDREYRVMKALAGSAVPVPEVHLYSDDASIVGTPFYVMEYLDGRVLADPALPGLPPAERTAIYAETGRVIAALHCVDPLAVGLADFGRAGNYFERQVARWSRQYRESRGDDIPAMDALIDWLPRRLPPGDASALVHGDFRIDNLVFHPVEPRVIGVLDWELATLGHPLADFSYHCLCWHVAPQLWRGIAGLDLDALGIPTEADYRRAYGAATGAAQLEHWDYYLAYNLFRIAAILQGIAKRAADGNAAGADAHETGRKAAPLAALGWHYAQRYEATR